MIFEKVINLSCTDKHGSQMVFDGKNVIWKKEEST